MWYDSGGSRGSPPAGFEGAAPLAVNQIFHKPTPVPIQSNSFDHGTLILDLGSDSINHIDLRVISTGFMCHCLPRWRKPTGRGKSFDNLRITITESKIIDQS